MEKQSKEKRQYTCVSYPKDQVDKVKEIIKYRMTGASTVSEYFKIYMETQIKTDFIRLESHLYDLEQLQQEKAERGE